MESRLILDGAGGAPANLALEEALLRGNGGLVLRLWGNERSVIIGRAQLARFETDVERCSREGIPIVRTGDRGRGDIQRPREHQLVPLRREGVQSGAG